MQVPRRFEVSPRNNPQPQNKSPTKNSFKQQTVLSPTLGQQSDEPDEFPWLGWWNNIRNQLQGEKQRTQLIDDIYQKGFQFWRKVEDVPTPKISARSWVVMDAQTGRMIWGKNEHARREIASLTKIMTCYLTMQLIEKLGVDVENTYIQISNYACSVGGTTANLRENDILSVGDLLHGMMLPSGNDAALALSENFGVYYYFQSKEFSLKYGNSECITNLKIQNPGSYFLKEMNDTAQKLGLQNTFYANTHGLANKLSRSSAYDVSKLCNICMKNQYFVKLINQKSYTCTIMNEGIPREVVWENTNRLLNYGFGGIKTGITNEAGPCLASFFKSKAHQYMVIILNCASKEERWIETCKIIDWVTSIYESQN